MNVRPPPLLRPVDPWPPDRSSPHGYQVLLAEGPFTVELDAGARVGFLLEERFDGVDERVLTWDDGDRLHYLADAGWISVAGALSSGVANGGTRAMIRPLLRMDYRDQDAYRDLPPDVVAEDLHRSYVVPALAWRRERDEHAS